MKLNGGLEQYLSKHASALALTKGAESFAAYRERLGIDTDGDYYRGMQKAMMKAVKSDPGYGNVSERLFSEGLADSGYALHLGAKAKEERERTERELAEKRSKAESEAVGGYLSYLESYAKASAKTMNDLRSRLIADGVVDTAISYEMAISSGLSHEAAEAVSRDVYAAGRERIMVTYNRIKIDKKMHADYRENYLRRFGRLVDVEEVASDEALTVVLDNGDMQIQDAYVGLISMTEEERKPFLGKKVGDKMQVNVNELYKTEAQRAAILQVKQEELSAIKPEFELEITKIRKFSEPELNEEFFKMAFPAGNVTSEKELDKMLDEEISRELGRESDYMFTLQVRNYLIEKAGLKMPEAFLKRWLYTINEGKFSMEDIEKDFDQFLQMFTWNFIQKQLIEQEKLTVTPEDATTEAKALAAAQFAQYGMPSAPEDMLEGYAKQILENKEQAQKIYEKLFEQKVVEAVKGKIKVTEKAISADDFAKMAKTL